MEWVRGFIRLPSQDIDVHGDELNFTSHQENKGSRILDKMETIKQYQVRGSMEPTLVNEEYLSVKFPVKVILVDKYKSEEGYMNQIFSIQDTITKITYLTSGGTLIEIKGDVEASRQFWEKVLGGKLEEIENGN